jgi:signal transduction histidine kinase
MTTVALPGRCRPTGGPAIAAIFGSALVGLAIVSFQSEWASFTRPPDVAVAVDIVGGVLSIVLLFAVRRAPVRLALVLSALLTVSAAATPAAGTATLWVAQRRRLPVAIGVAAAGVLGHVIRAFWRPTPDRPFGLWLVVVAASYAALVGWGAQNQARRALVQSLEERARRAEEEQAHRLAEARRGERTKIAREMHDVLAHRLSLLAAYAGALEFRPDAPPEELARASGVIRAGAHEALEELREVIGVLRDDPTDEERDRPQPTLTDLPRLLAESRAAGTPVRLDDRLADPGTVPDVLGRTVYRVVQEALTNARKHAPGREVTVLLAGEPGRRLLVVVTNPTSGSSATAHQDRVPGSGSGLVGLRERVTLAGGRMDTKAGRGRFRLWAVLPWPG